MELYAGIDLHSSNNYTGVINEEDKRLYGKRLPNQLEPKMIDFYSKKPTRRGKFVV